MSSLVSRPDEPHLRSRFQERRAVEDAVCYQQSESDHHLEEASGSSREGDHDHHVLAVQPVVHHSESRSVRRQPALCGQ